MSRKDKKRNSPVGQAGAVGEVERLLQQCRSKDAFKQAKILFNQHGTPEYHALVERTYLSRIQELIKGGMLEGAREVVLSLFEFGVTSPERLQIVIPHLPRLGLLNKALELQDKLASPEEKAGLLLSIADRAVTHPAETPPSLTEIREGAAAIRYSLAALDANDEPRALELLQAIPRSSPLADWRYFVRGLAAHRRKDPAQARANWEHLDRQRAAHKIASTLQSLAESASGPAAFKGLGVLETKEFGEPVIERIGQLQKAMEAGEWKRVLQLIPPIRITLRRVNLTWAQRLTEIVLGPLATELQQHPYRDAQHLCRSFMSALEPLPWDPRWHRFQAILWEGPQGSTDEAIELWKKFAQDLEQVESVFGVKSSRVQALVWRRIGSMSASLDDEDDDDDFYSDDEIDLDEDFEPGFRFEPDEDSEGPEEHEDSLAIEALHKSLSLDPSQRKTYEQLIDVYEERKDAEGAAATARQLLAVFPNDVEAMRLLINYHMKQDEPKQVLNYLEQIRKLKPLESQGQHQLVWARLVLARQLTIRGEWEAARAEISLAESIPHQNFPPYSILARKAALEFKAGQAERAEDFVRQAKDLPVPEAAFWLGLAIEADRYELPNQLTRRFNDLLQESLKKKVTSQTAGAITEHITPFVELRINYAHHGEHVDSVFDYLKRTSRIKYRETDLRSVCGFLRLLPEHKPMLQKMAARGLKLFPKSPYFLHLAATFEMTKGPFGFNKKLVRKQLETALSEAQVNEETLVRGIKESLLKLDDMEEATGGFPFPGRRGSRGPQGGFQSFLDMMANELDSLGIDLDSLPPDSFGPRRPRGKRGK
jgi:tetratricopeptide (TPR) repeat protein